MFGSEILDVTIGLIFIYLLVAIICSSIREAIEGWLKTRAAYLEHGIRELLHDLNATGLARNFYNHPLIYSLYSEPYEPGEQSAKPKTLARGRNLPSYIPSRNFAIALMDIAARGPRTDVYTSNPASPAITLDSVRANILNISNEPVQRALLAALDTAQGDFNRGVAAIQDWYDSAMDRVSGWYKRSTQRILLWIGLAIAIALNINTVTIADYLYHDDAARAAIVARAQSVAGDTTMRNERNYQRARLALDSLELPIGWKDGLGTSRRPPTNAGDIIWFDILSPTLGWLLTALAAMFGAPFWFDLLNRIMVIRSTVKPHEKSPEESSEDRQSKGTTIEIVNRTDASNTTPPPSQPPPAPPPNASPSFAAKDPESDVDGCDVEMGDETADEDLPPARGGVA